MKSCRSSKHYSTVEPGFKFTDENHRPLFNRCSSTTFPENNRFSCTNVLTLEISTCTHEFFILKNWLAVPKLLYFIHYCPIWLWDYKKLLKTYLSRKYDGKYRYQINLVV